MEISLRNQPRWWGSDAHKFYTVVVFIVLASLDNMARAAFPPLYAVMALDLGVSESALGLITSLTILVLSLTAVGWGYWGDRSSRKWLLIGGTLIWSTAMLLTGLATSYAQVLVWQLLTAVGIGCIASVSFSLVSDFTPPARRGLAMSLWGLAQGGGGGLGVLLGGFLGASHWPLPFFVIGSAGLLIAGLYLFAFEPSRGRAEPELAGVFAAGETYNYRIHWADVRSIITRRSNVWLMLVALFATVAYGALVWLPRLFIARVEQVGYGLEVATMSGNLLSLLLQTGFNFTVLAGFLGDRWQRRQLGGRARLAMLGTIASVPFQIAALFIPLRGLALPAAGEIAPVALATLVSIVINPWVLTAFVLALLAWALASADIPNRNAILTDVNLPEHRGTAVGFLTIAIGLGAALGSGLTGLVVDALSPYLAAPLNYVVGLAVFQLLFIPAGWCYYKLTQASAADTTAVRQTLARRAETFSNGQPRL
ncbi:MAG: hypothetical protein FOGNACKC_02554 [Anaerolineae bacterium]|nr:hypothetical protein [Anaerolineae bacterium]